MRKFLYSKQRSYKRGDRVVLPPVDDPDVNEPEVVGIVTDVEKNDMYIVQIEEGFSGVQLEDGDDGIREVHVNDIDGIYQGRTS